MTYFVRDIILGPTVLAKTVGPFTNPEKLTTLVKTQGRYRAPNSFQNTLCKSSEILNVSVFRKMVSGGETLPGEFRIEDD